MRKQTQFWLLLGMGLSSLVGAQEKPPMPPKPTSEVQKLIDEGRAAIGKQDWTKALSVFKQARKIAQTAHDTEGEAIAIGSLGSVSYNTNQPQKALDYFANALALYRKTGDKAGEAKTLFNTALIYGDNLQLQKGLDGFLQVLPLSRQLGDIQLEANTLNGIGVDLIRLGKPDQALDYYKQALALHQKNKDTQGEALALLNIGRVYGITSPKDSIAWFEKAMPLYKQNDDKNGQADVFNNLGLAYSDTGQTDKALEAHRQAVPLYHEAGDIAGEASANNNIGRTYARRGLLYPALESFEQALPLYRKAQLKDRVAIALGNIGMVYNALGRREKALDMQLQALDLQRERGRLDNLANLMVNISVLYASLGQPETALEYCQQALDLSRKVQDKNTEAITLRRIGGIYAVMGQSLKTVQFCQQALAMFQKQNNKNEQAHTFQFIGEARSTMGQQRDALEDYSKALALFHEVQDRGGEAATLIDMGLALFRNKQYSAALAQYNQALELLKGQGTIGEKAATLNNIGLLYASQRQTQKAVSYYRQALDLFQQGSDKGNQATTLTNIGRVQNAAGDYAHAEQAFQSALTLQEEIRTAIGGVENRQGFLAAALPTYDGLIFAQIQRHEWEQAFATLNQKKGRTLIEQITDKSRLQGVPPEAQAKLKILQARCDRLSLAVTGAERQGGTVLAQAQSALREAEQNLQIEQDSLFARYPGAAQKNIAKTIILADVSKFLPADSALLDFAVLSTGNPDAPIEQCAVLVTTLEKGKPHVTVYPLVIPPKKLIPMTEQFRKACANPDRAYQPLARSLAVILLPPDMMNRLAGKKRLVICPDGAVWNVPFAALILPNGKHLIEQFEIDYAYSATGAQAALSVPHTKAQGMLVVANPDFGDTSRFGESLPSQIVNGKERPLSEPARPLSDPARPLSDPARPLSDPARLSNIMERGKIKPLPGTQREANALRKLSPDALMFTGSNAQEAKLIEVLPHYRYLHFATHGLFSDVSPLQSAIVLAVPPKDSAEDGFLTAREIYALNLNAEMAVLSACETARGVNLQGEGVVGLTWAFFAAGVPTQVVSQWKVSDASTPKLMTQFYGNIKNKERKGQALRKASLSLMKDGNHAHPYHWAAFVLFGDWR